MKIGMGQKLKKHFLSPKVRQTSKTLFLIVSRDDLDDF